MYDSSIIFTTTTTTTTASSNSNSMTRSTNYENYEQYYLSRVRPWCLGSTYDYCPLMIIVMLFVILISVILIIILCIHNQKPYITRLIISYLINKKNKFVGVLLCRKNNYNDNNSQSDGNRVFMPSQHSAIHNSIWWVNYNNNNELSENRQAPPTYEESLNNNNNRSNVHLTSVLTPVATSVSTSSSSGYSSSGFNTVNVNNAFINEDNCIAPQVRQFRETGIDTIELPEENYYENRRFNSKNLSFMSTDSFQFVQQTTRPITTQSSISLQTVPQTKTIKSTSTLRSEYNELPPDYDTALNLFNKKLDIDNLNKFKKLQQKYQQSACQTRKNYYQQRLQQSNKHNRQSTATILSEVEIVV